MTKDEALKLALEALEGLKSIPGGRHELHELNAIHRKHERAITAIKAALEAKNEPVVFNTLASLKHKKTVGPIENAMSNTTPPAQSEQKRPPNCGTGYCSCIECVMEPKPVKWSDHEPDGMHHKQEKNT
jgi:hypothetical protein